MKVGSLFSGYGGLSMAVEQFFGARTAWHSEIEPAMCKVLEARWPGVPNLGDVTAVDWSQVEPVDVLDGGSPCQDVSSAGKRAGMRAGTRSGLWAAMVDAIDVLRPEFVVWENVRGVLSAGADSALEPCAGCVGDGRSEPVLRALGRVLGDLADLGYDARWCGLRAADVGAPHGRYRIFVLASDAERVGRDGRSSDARWGQVGGAVAGRTGEELVADARGGPFARAGAAGDGLLIASERSYRPPTDPDRDALRQQPVTERRSGSASVAAIPVQWGIYEPAVHRWERTLGRVAPAPTEPGPKGGRRLSPRFVEWMMGLPAGWVTDLPISRNDMLRGLGNGVVPQQAFEALRRISAASEVAA